MPRSVFRRRHRRPAILIGSTPNSSLPPVHRTVAAIRLHTRTVVARRLRPCSLSHIFLPLVRSEFSQTHAHSIFLTLSLTHSLSHAFRVWRSAFGVTQSNPYSEWSRVKRAVRAGNIVVIYRARGFWSLGHHR